LAITNLKTNSDSRPHIDAKIFPRDYKQKYGRLYNCTPCATNYSTFGSLIMAQNARDNHQNIIVNKGETKYKFSS